MSEVKGHAAFHKHKDAPRHPGTKAGTRAERRALLKESMRHLDQNEVVRQAKKNSNIVTADAHLNVAYVNDGNGGFEVATGIKQVLDYGDAREEKTRYLREGSRTVDLFVVHLPKTMCVEIKDFYPRYNPDGSERLDPETGEPMSRSRWVARDRDEAMRYFVSAVGFLGEDVSPGGMDSIHGWATNFDESTPHIQVMADPFAPDPKVPGALRTEASRAYSSHRDVVCPEGTVSIHRDKTTRFYRRLGDPMGFAFTPEERAQLEQLAGKPYDQIDLADLKALDGQKLSGGIVRYAEGKPAWGEYKMQAAQGAMRERMIAEGYPVEYEPGEHHGRELPKEVYEEVQDEKAEAASLRAAGHEAIVDAAEAAAVAEIDAQLDQQESEIENALLVDEWAEIDEAEDDLEERARDVGGRESELIGRKRKLDARERAVVEGEQTVAADRAQLDRDLAELPELRAAARAEGLKAAEASAETAVAACIANAEAEAQRITESAQRAAQARLDAADKEIAAERAELTETPMAFDEFLNKETKEGRDTAERYRKHTELYYLHNKRRPQFLNDHDRAAMRGERKTVSGRQQLVASMEEDKKRPNTSGSGSGEDGQGLGG